MHDTWGVAVRPDPHRQACWSDVDFVHGIGIFDSASSSHDPAPPTSHVCHCDSTPRGHICEQDRG